MSIIRSVAASLLGLVLGGPLVAQETVLNVPSGDILDKGKLYGEFDFSYRPTDSLKTFTPRLVVGVGHRLEVGVNINGIAAPVESQTTVTPTIKWKPYESEQTGWAFVVGNNFFIPVQNKSYDAGTWVYAEAVKAWKTNTRATFGAYYASKNVFAPFQRAGGQFAIEQTLSKRVTVAADWFTGNSSIGYVTPGAVVKVTSKWTLYLAYQIGNSGTATGNHQLMAMLGYSWN